jgi:lipoprotein
MNKCLLTLSLILCVVLSSCKSKVDPPSSITLNEEGRIMEHGDEFQLTATPSRGVTFSSEDKNVASVSSSGLVTAGLIGKTRIVATAGSVQAFCNIEVHPKIRTFPEPLLLFGEGIERVKERFDTKYPEAEYAESEGQDSFARFFPNIRVDNELVDLTVQYRSSDEGKLVAVEYMTQGIHTMRYLPSYVNERYLEMGRETYSHVYLSVDKRVKVSVSISTGRQTATFTHGPRP